MYIFFSYVYLYVHAYIYVHECIHTYTYMYTYAQHMHLRVCVYIYTQNFTAQTQTTPRFCHCPQVRRASSPSPPRSRGWASRRSRVLTAHIRSLYSSPGCLVGDWGSGPHGVLQELCKDHSLDRLPRSLASIKRSCRDLDMAPVTGCGRMM